ncbi:MAG: peptide chain release factor N(5)-glutamine methyltransferase [Candidatus Babeliales bacterium]|jgi:release factor glutamine methyltransferase
MTRSLHQFIENIATRLATCCVHEREATQEAWLILEKVMDTTRTNLLSMASIALTPAQQKRLDFLVEQRVVHHQPLAYLLGSVPFCDLDILVEPPILIPRPETEEWVTWLIEQLKCVQPERFTILDLCTGSGCIALALAHAFPLATVIGVDNNPHALALANKNKKHLNIANATFMCGDLFAALPHDFTCDLIVANPPYITENEYHQLQPEVAQWEDKNALVASNHGLDFYQRIAQNAGRYLTAHSLFVSRDLPRISLEVGLSPESVVAICRDAGFNRCELHCDMQGSPRWAVVRI